MKIRMTCCFALCAILSLCLSSVASAQYQISSPYQGANQNWRGQQAQPQSQAYFSNTANSAIKSNAIAYGNTGGTAGDCGSGCSTGCDTGCGGCGIRGRRGCGLGSRGCQPAGCDPCSDGGCGGGGCGLFGGLGGGCGNNCGGGCCGGGIGSGGLIGNNCGSGCGPDYTGCRYFSLFGGWTRPQDIGLNFYIGGGGAGAPSGNGGLHLAMQDGWAFGGALGRYVRPNVRAEFELAYRNSSFDSVTGSGLAAPLGTIALDGKANIYSSMINIVFDCNRFSRITPYFGVGAGVAWLDADLVEPTTPLALSVQDSSFAVQAMLGFASRLNDRTDFFAEYRVFATDKTELGVSALGLNANAELETTVNNFFFGFRVKRR